VKKSIKITTTTIEQSTIINAVLEQTTIISTIINKLELFTSLSTIIIINITIDKLEPISTTIFQGCQSEFDEYYNGNEKNRLYYKYYYKN